MAHRRSRYMSGLDMFTPSNADNQFNQQWDNMSGGDIPASNVPNLCDVANALDNHAQEISSHADKLRRLGNLQPNFGGGMEGEY